MNRRIVSASRGGRDGTVKDVDGKVSRFASGRRVRTGLRPEDDLL